METPITIEKRLQYIDTAQLLRRYDLLWVFDDNFDIICKFIHVITMYDNIYLWIHDDVAIFDGNMLTTTTDRLIGIADHYVPAHKDAVG